MEDISSEIKRHTRENLLEVWEMAKTKDVAALPDELRRLAEIMLLHRGEYGHRFDSTQVVAETDTDPGDEADPFMHITVHAIVQNQLEKRDPVEAYQFYNAMRNQKCPHHEALHLIAAIMTPMLYAVLKNQKEFDLAGYKKLLKRYKQRRPEKIPDLLDREVYKE